MAHIAAPALRKPRQDDLSGKSSRLHSEFQASLGTAERHLISENADGEWERVLQGYSGEKLSTDTHRRSRFTTLGAE